MAEDEQPERLRPDRPVTVDDVRQLMGASTPHFALQLRNRIRNLIARPARRGPGAARGRARDRPPRAHRVHGRDARRAGAGGPARAALQPPGRADAVRARRRARVGEAQPRGRRPVMLPRRGSRPGRRARTSRGARWAACGGPSCCALASSWASITHSRTPRASSACGPVPACARSARRRTERGSLGTPTSCHARRSPTDPARTLIGR